MSRAISLGLVLLAAGGMSYGRSEEAAYLTEQGENKMPADDRSVYLGSSRRAFEEELYSVANEASEAGWDGYGGAPVDQDAVSMVRRLIGLLSNIPLPEPSVDPDGEVALEWASGKDRYLFVSVSGNGRVSFNWRSGAEHGYGVTRFNQRSVPRALQVELSRLGLV